MPLTNYRGRGDETGRVGKASESGTGATEGA